MSETTPFALTRHMEGLMGRKVTFKQADAMTPETGRQIYGVYTVLPNDVVLVAKADLALLASFAGCLVGLPSAAIRDRLPSIAQDEVLNDGMHETLNVLSTVITGNGRAIFKNFVLDPAYLDAASTSVVRKPLHRSYFSVSVEGYDGGKFSIFESAA